VQLDEGHSPLETAEEVMSCSTGKKRPHKGRRCMERKSGQARGTDRRGRETSEHGKKVNEQWALMATHHLETVGGTCHGMQREQ